MTVYSGGVAVAEIAVRRENGQYLIFSDGTTNLGFTSAGVAALGGIPIPTDAAASIATSLNASVKSNVSTIQVRKP